MTNIVWLQCYICEDLLNLSVWNIFGFWNVGWTKQTHLNKSSLWEVILGKKKKKKVRKITGILFNNKNNMLGSPILHYVQTVSIKSQNNMQVHH